MPTRIRIEPRPPQHDDDAVAPRDPTAQPPAVFDRGCFLALLAGVASPFPHAVGSWSELAPHMPFAVQVWFWAGLACLIYGVLGRPLARLLRRAHEESARLREAMTCPYCRDRLEDQALLCGRSACGAIYHPECWDECREEYGGCAIYGCGHTHATEVGRFALQRRLARLVLAAVLFPPRAVARLRELEGKSFREVWEEAQAHQRRVSQSDLQTLAYGALNLVLSFVCLGVVALTLNWVVLDATQYSAIPLVAMFVFPVLFVRFPLARAFGWGSTKLVARAFRGELGALGRADAGTVLGRLFAGVGKKPGSL